MIRKAGLPSALLKASGIDDRVIRAYREAVRRYAGKPGISGISISRKESGGRLTASTQPVIAIHVRRKRPLAARSRVAIPPTILDVSTDVIHGNYKRASGLVTAPVTTLAPGASISCTRGTAGTLGAVVRDSSGSRGMLTAAHVLRECGKCKKGAIVVQPGRADSGGVVVARLADTHFGLDSGTAILEPGVTAHNLALVSGVRITTPIVPQLGDVVEKVGRTTGVTRARVQGIGTFDNVFPAIQLRPLLGGLATVISEPGDSGAVWYHADSGAAVGLHVAGGVSEDNSYAVAAVVTEVMDALELTWT